MKRNIVVPHEDASLNLLRLAALAGVGIYLFKSYKKEGSLLGATGKNIPFKIDADKIIDNVAPKLNLTENQTESLKNIIKTHILK